MARARRVRVLLFAAGLSGCFLWPARVNLESYAHRVDTLPAAGIHGLGYSVEVVDERGLDDPHDMGTRRGSILYKPKVIAHGEPAVGARAGIRQELRLHDLRVVGRDESDVHLRVRLQTFYAHAKESAVLLDLEGGSVRAFIEGEVDVLDGRSGRLVATVPISASGEAGSPLLSARYYEYALNNALTEFSARVIRHPDVLIAVQDIAD